MKRLYAAGREEDPSELYLYEATSAEEVAKLWFDADEEQKGQVIRVFEITKDPPAFVLDSALAVRELYQPPEVKG